jgi:hypothetical protein
MILSRTLVHNLQHTPPCSKPRGFGYLIPIFGAHYVLIPRRTLIMPPCQTSHRLHLDEGRPQSSGQNQPPLDHPPTQILPTITEGSEQLAFGDIPEVQLHQPSNNMSINAHAPVRIAETLAQPKPMGVTHTSHPCGLLRQHKSFKVTSSPTQSKCKIGRKKITKMKLQKRRRN